MLNTLLEQDTFWDVGSNQGEIVKQVKSLFGEEFTVLLLSLIQFCLII